MSIVSQLSFGIIACISVGNCINDFNTYSYYKSGLALCSYLIFI